MSISTNAMQGKSPSPDDMAAAERWYARLKAADCTAADRMEFQSWRATPEHAAAYTATTKLWESLGGLAGRADLEKLSRQILADTAQQHRRSPAMDVRRRIVIAASILLAVLSGGAFLGLQNRATATIVYATQPGERSSIELADGSQVVLNSATELDVRISNGTRGLTLHKGEAVFTVAHDRTRPFKVAAGDGEVTALGTRFQIRNEGKHVTITLLEGRVVVDRREAHEHVQLEPGDQVRFTVALREMVRRTVDPEVSASWSTGRLRFRSTPLAEALSEVNRYSTIQIRVADPTLASIPISGTFAIGDGISVVSALEALLPIHADKAGEEILLRHR
jgi:transmembrane sensor